MLVRKYWWSGACKWLAAIAGISSLLLAVALVIVLASPRRGVEEKDERLMDMAVRCRTDYRRIAKAKAVGARGEASRGSPEVVREAPNHLHGPYIHY